MTPRISEGPLIGDYILRIFPERRVQLTHQDGQAITVRRWNAGFKSRTTTLRCTCR